MGELIYGHVGEWVGDHGGSMVKLTVEQLGELVCAAVCTSGCGLSYRHVD